MPASKGTGKGLHICAAQAALEGLAAREAKIIAAAKAGGSVAAIKAAMKG